MYPQFNILNINNILFDAIFKTYIILNPNKDKREESKLSNYEKYSGKEVLTCLMTLNSSKPIFFKFDFKKDDLLLKNSIL